MLGVSFFFSSRGIHIQLAYELSIVIACILPIGLFWQVSTSQTTELNSEDIFPSTPESAFSATTLTVIR